MFSKVRDAISSKLNGGAKPLQVGLQKTKQIVEDPLHLREHRLDAQLIGSPETRWEYIKAEKVVQSKLNATFQREPVKARKPHLPSLLNEGEAKRVPLAPPVKAAPVATEQAPPKEAQAAPPAPEIAASTPVLTKDAAPTKMVETVQATLYKLQLTEGTFTQQEKANAQVAFEWLSTNSPALKDNSDFTKLQEELGRSMNFEVSTTVRRQQAKQLALAIKGLIDNGTLPKPSQSIPVSPPPQKPTIRCEKVSPQAFEKLEAEVRAAAAKKRERREKGLDPLPQAPVQKVQAPVEDPIINAAAEKRVQAAAKVLEELREEGVDFGTTKFGNG